MITLTEKAADQVKLLMQQNSYEDGGLRVGVGDGGCSGLSYLLEIVSDAEPDDRVFDSAGVPIFCDPKSYLLLDGTEVDYSNELMGGGFSFSNPNAKRACNCGTSFGC